VRVLVMVVGEAARACLGLALPVLRATTDAARRSYRDMRYSHHLIDYPVLGTTQVCDLRISATASSQASAGSATSIARTCSTKSAGASGIVVLGMVASHRAAASRSRIRAACSASTYSSGTNLAGAVLG
jgi:hypothetical protein